MNALDPSLSAMGSSNTLAQVVRNVVQRAPLCDMETLVRAVFMDFIADKFTGAILKAEEKGDEESLEMLRELYASLTDLDSPVKAPSPQVLGELTRR